MARCRLGDGVILLSVIEERAPVEDHAEPAGELASVPGEIVRPELIHRHDDHE